MNLINIKDAVKQILRVHEETRDDDKLLILKVWAIQLPELRNSDFSFIKFSHLFLKGDLADSESITRCRRKLQEMHEELRGKNYKARQEHTEDVKEQIKSMEK